jgi:hypothetical protein
MANIQEAEVTATTGGDSNVSLGKARTPRSTAPKQQQRASSRQFHCI